MCHGKAVSVANSLAALFPDIAAQWHPTKSDDLAPDLQADGTLCPGWPVRMPHAVGKFEVDGSGLAHIDFLGGY